MGLLKTLLLIMFVLVIAKLVVDAVGSLALGVVDHTYIKGKNVGKNLMQHV